MIKKIVILAFVATLVASMTVASVLACTTRTPGYWKTHGPGSKHADWPEECIVTVGADGYDVEDPGDVDALLDILWDRPKGDAWIILAQKVIAAQLSMCRYPGLTNWANPANFGGYTGGMPGMVSDANALLSAAGSYLPGSSGRGAVTDLAGTIDYWLNFWDEYGL